MSNVRYRCGHVLYPSKVYRGLFLQTDRRTVLRVVDIPEVLAQDFGTTSIHRWVSLCDSEGTPATAAKCFADSARCQACGVPRFSPLSPNMAQKEWCAERFGTLLDGTRARGRGPVLETQKTTFHSASCGRNAPDLALSWYTLVYKTQRQ